jgi:hypothetical protein
VSSGGSATLRIGDVELGGVAAFAANWSINGRDRYQETLRGELSTSDQLAIGAAVVTYRPGGTPIVVAGRLENIRRTGSDRQPGGVGRRDARRRRRRPGLLVLGVTTPRGDDGDHCAQR